MYDRRVPARGEGYDGSWDGLTPPLSLVPFLFGKACRLRVGCGVGLRASLVEPRSPSEFYSKGCRFSFDCCHAFVWCGVFFFPHARLAYVRYSASCLSREAESGADDVGVAPTAGKPLLASWGLALGVKASSNLKRGPMASSIAGYIGHASPWRPSSKGLLLSRDAPSVRVGRFFFL